MIRIIILCLIIVVIDFYGYEFIKTLYNAKWLKLSYIILSLLIILLTFYNYSIGRNTWSIQTSNLITGIFIVIYITKLIIATIYFGNDIYRYSKSILNYLFQSKNSNSSFYIPSRRKFIGYTALGLAALPFASLLYGIFKGKYNFRVINHTLYFEDLPTNFEDYKITQISDIHSGSFDNEDKIKYAIDLINEQKSDALFFTGDLVNLKASEMDPWISIFSNLKAKDGLFSVLGNHDYGDYFKWDNEKLKKQNFKKILSTQKKIGFDLLLNEKRFIKKGKERIAIIGVENWGKGFVKKGDLKKATDGTKNQDFKIVLSHDPTHWQEQIKDNSENYHLTLSGHTHGMQMGIEIPGWFKWSPIKWRYKYWAGIYKENNKYLNVNRGFGFLAYPGRIGIWPEITVIRLKKK